MTESLATRIARRSFDVTASAAGLVALSPIFVAVGALVRFDSLGPVVFRQERVGLNGKRFVLLKFRTMRSMVVNEQVKVTAAGDPRITRVGRTLRRSKLDELPQLVNVLKGDMSFVGPRPEVPEFVALWPRDMKAIVLSVRPGITDPVTLGLRNEEVLLAESDSPISYYRDVLAPRKLEGYVAYVQRRSLLGDLAILLGTIKLVVLKCPCPNP